MKKTLTVAAVALLGVAALGAMSPRGAVAGENGDKVTICHVAGRADDPANYNTLTIGWNAVYGPGGHFNEHGTPQAGHEQDTLGECDPPVVVEVDEPTMSAPDCDAPGAVVVPEVTGLVYSTETLEDGSVEVTVKAAEGYVLAADSETSWTFAAADLAQWAVDDPRCVESLPPIVTPPAEVTPAVVPPVVAPPTEVGSAGPVPAVVTPPAAVAPAAVTPTALPATGGLVWPIFLIGLTALAAGIGAVRLARRTT
ncbi:MAG TPA: hypothetical protein VLN74_08330 [Ilumatobacteraceae bacterium]|nr:hypothetical protein [Ilumatobacteraceae bacterium]